MHWLQFGIIAWVTHSDNYLRPLLIKIHLWFLLILLILFCNDCQLGKYSKLSLILTNNISNVVLDIKFSDVWGLSPSLFSDGHRYFVIIVHHFSKYIWFYPLTKKSDVFHDFPKFVSIAEP